MTYCRSPRNRRRWEITLLDSETDDEVTHPDRTWAFLSRWITPEDADLERSAVYTFRSAVAQQWRKGRMMIAGDAAHLTPPFMGQGMCAGIRDASNLAWKLALVVQGKAFDPLLDSYQAERAPNARAFIETAIRLGGLINSLDRQSALAMASQDDAGVAKLRTIAPPLGDSDLGGLVPRATPGKGHLFGQPQLANGRRLDDEIGLSPVLILRGDLPVGSTSQPLVFTAKDHPQLEAALDELDTNAVLVRPDRYIAATAKTDADIEALASIRLPSPLSKTKESELAL